MSECNGTDINPGIRKTVALLNAHGFTTTDSGDGETHDHACDRDMGYVVVVTAPALLIREAGRLRTLLEDNGVTVGPLGPSPVDDVVSVQASYDVADGTAIIDVSNIHDDLLGGGSRKAVTADEPA